MTLSQRMKSAKREGEMAAERLVSELKLSVAKPIDVFGVIEDLEVWLLFQKLDKALGVYFSGSSAGILINSERPIGVQRLTAAHELGHHILKHGEGLDDPVSLRAAPGKRRGAAQNLSVERYLQEISAQAFAMSFLAPAELVRTMMGILGIERDKLIPPERVYELSLHLGMSHEATAHRLVALRELDPDRLDGVLIPPAQAKQNIGHGLKPKDGKADVWPIGPRQRGTLINARVGDELALSLEETPSSGYRWAIEADTDGFAVRLDDFVSADNAAQRPRAGGKGERRITVRIERPGENRFRLSYVRAWRPQEPINSFHVMVDAEEMPGKEAAPRHSARQALIEAER